MVEFLVRIDIDTGDLQPVEVERLRRAEGNRAAELAQQGVLVGLWRVPGRWANVGVWAAADRAALEAQLSSLPLRPYMTIDIQELDAHPSDPRKGTARSTVEFTLDPLPELTLRRRERDNARSQAPVPSEYELTALPELTVTTRRSGPPVTAPPGSTTSSSRAQLEVDLGDLLDGADTASAARRLESLVHDALQARGESSSQLVITHSGREGLDSAQIAPSSAALAADIGRIRRVPAVRTSSDGTEVLQIRSVATITLWGDEQLTLEGASALLRLVQDSLRGRP